MKSPGKLLSKTKLRNLLLFLLFVGIAAVFWCILALNEESRYDYDVKISIVNVPDSVTFITDPPSTARISVSDKASLLARHAVFNDLEIRIDFNQFASDSRLRVSHSSLNSFFRGLFGKSSSISILNIDSISAPFTTAPPKVVPVVVEARITPVLGKIVSGNPVPSVSHVKVYSYPAVLDTISCVRTETIILKGLADSKKVSTGFRPMRNVKIVPSTIDVLFNIVPLENRKTYVEITPSNVPQGCTLATFPSKVEVTYLAPMDKDQVQEDMFSVIADWNDITSASDKIHISLRNLPKHVVSAQLSTDSVEFTIIRHE